MFVQEKQFCSPEHHSVDDPVKLIGILCRSIIEKKLSILVVEKNKV